MLSTVLSCPEESPSVATWPLNPSPGRPQLVCFSDSHFQTEMAPCSIDSGEGATIPLCHFHSFFDVLAFLFPLPAGLWDLAPDFIPTWKMVESVLFCNILFMTKHGICSHLTNQCRKVFSAPSLLPKTASSRHDDACQCILLCLPSQQSQSWLTPDTFLQFFLPMLRCPLPQVRRSRLFHEHVLHVFWANVSHVHLYMPFKG